MCIRKLPVEVVPLTPELATRFHKMERSSVERRPKPSRLDKLEALCNHLMGSPTFGVVVMGGAERAKAWQPGEYMTGSPKRYIRINGQHISDLIANGRVAIPHGMQAIVEPWVVDDIEEIRDCWGVYDNRISPNTLSEVMFTEKDADPMLGDIPDRLFTKIASGVKMFHDNIQGVRADADQTVHARRIKACRKDILFCYRVLDGAPDWMLRAPTIAAMIGSFRKAPLLAEDFWTKVVNLSGTDKTDPPLALAQYLMTTSVDKKMKGKDVDDREVMYRKCIVAWNRWRAGSRIKVLRAPFKAGRPEVR